MYENKEEIEKVILFAVDLDNDEQVPANLDELEELVATAGAETLGRMIQNKDSIEKATYLGSGKVEELRDMVERLGATGVVCDDELSPIQMKNLEQELDTKVMDRTMVILDIFAKHATTREADCKQSHLHTCCTTRLYDFHILLMCQHTNIFEIFSKINSKHNAPPSCNSSLQSRSHNLLIIIHNLQPKSNCRANAKNELS